MGLDMYLSAEKYLYSFRDDDIAEAKKIGKAIGTKRRVKSVSVEVAYWRKANAIHGWFVRNVQDGEDDCKPYSLDMDTLKELRELCNKLLKNKNADEAMQLLPPQDGFFFGSAEVDEYYWEDLKLTVKQIDEILADPLFNESWDFVYQSSW